VRLGDGDGGNFIDRTGGGGGGGFGGGGNMLGCLLPLIASRFGMVGVLVLLLGYCALQSLGGGGGFQIPGAGTSTTAPAGPDSQSTLPPEMGRFMSNVLDSTDGIWAQLFASSGQRYTEPKMIAYSNTDRSGCGVAQAAMGPFYCPTDRSIYIDPQFFGELSRRFQAPGDFAQAYVIAHEVGHHVQNLEGTLDRARTAQARLGEAEGNRVQVGVELQADCYAGVWAHHAKAPDGTAAMEAGDLQEGMRAAEAIGDDALTQGRASPDSFTHGTSAQRMEALQRGYRTGDPASCNYNR
jgi:uncharacterized protein